MRGRGLQFGHHLEIGQRQFVVVGGLHQQARAHAFHVDRIATFVPSGDSAGRKSDLEQAQIGFGLESGQCSLREAGRHQYFHKLFGDRLGRHAVDFAIECDDAAEGRRWVGLERLVVGLQRVGG